MGTVVTLGYSREELRIPSQEQMTDRQTVEKAHVHISTSCMVAQRNE
jgi:hypothetical protein